MALPSVKIEKTFPFKGGVRLWSNRYHFTGGTPADNAHWENLFDAVVAAEKACFEPTLTIVEAIGYAAGSDVPVHSKVYSTAGTLAATGSFYPGECVALCRFATAARSVKNHPIYGFSFWHYVLGDGAASTADKLNSTQRTAMQTYANDWISGFSDGTITAVRATPSGHTCTAAFVEEYISHRDFPYSRSA